MDRDFFLNAGLQMPAWKLMTLMPEMNFPPEQSPAAAPSWEKSTQFESDPGNTSCYRTPLNSSPIMDHFVKENLPSLRNSVPLNPNLPSVAADPGFAERAAKFSCFGSRSFNGGAGHSGLNSDHPDFQFRSGVSPLTRVSSSPSLKATGSPTGIQEMKNSDETNMETFDQKLSRFSGSAANSNEESSVSEQIPIGDNRNDANSRKRKAASSRGKAKEMALATAKEGEAKRLKQKEEENGSGEESQSLGNKNTKLPEPPKDYIHVRARRGQATDSHSLAERVRREKISERMKLLQDLVPNCNKVTGKALMLDEIINYVQSLQRQVEFLSMKLATVNPRLDFDMNSQLSKDISNQPKGNLSQQMYPMESSGSAFYQQNPQVQFNGSAPVTQSSMDPLQAFSHFPGFGQDDLQSIVQMGFSENLDQFLHGVPNQASDMKIEL